jgi:sialate O-acetylesterase
MRGVAFSQRLEVLFIGHLFYLKGFVMTESTRIFWALSLGFFLFLNFSLLGDIKVPVLIGDNMVLQQKVKVRLWGKADPGESVTVSFQDQSAHSTADTSGRWSLFLNPLPAGGPFELKFSGKNTLTFRNILVGEVWICSGQSNMEWPLIQAARGKEEAEQAENPNLRLFTVTKTTALNPQEDVAGRWEVSTPRSAAEFSAVGYFFGRELSWNLKIPIGLINTSWGGTPAEAWTSQEALEAEVSLRPIVTRLEKVLADARSSGAVKEEAQDSGYYKDQGNQGFSLGYAKPELDLAEWKKMTLPQLWENAGLAIDGAVWFRKEINLPAGWSGKDLVLELGAIDDFDATYFNGIQVAATGLETPGSYAVPRKYPVPGSLVKSGRNVVSVRVFDHFGGGGFGGDAAEMRLRLKQDPSATPLGLAGSWDYKVELSLKPKLEAQRLGPNNPNTPSVLYNAMVAPLTPFALRGAIWYQGESNASRAYQYRSLFPAMIQNWRQAWNQPGFPFYFVQLANFMNAVPEPGESEWAELREAQLFTTRSPNTGMAVIIDIGEAKDIHPKNKQDVGLRLARIALAETYGQSLVSSGPLFRSARQEGNKMVVRFTDAGSGLTTRNHEPLKGFAIAGTDRQWVWAEAEIRDGEVVVWNDRVPVPVAVRYGWANNPDCNLYNREGLPASPFRSDQWPGLTAGKE